MNSEQKAFEAAIRELLRERSSLLLSGERRALKLIRAAQGEVLQLLAAQPSDWQQWQLTQLQAQMEAIIGGATGQAATVVTGTLGNAWQAGQDMLDAGLRTLGVSTQAMLPLQDTRVLKAMRGFVEGRFRDVGSVATNKIDTAIAMVLMGGKTPHQAMQDVQKVLGGESARRAQTIVRTEASRAFAVAANERLVQGAALVPGMKKQWRRSGKLHSRWTHDVVDGQVVDVGKPFKVPNPGGGSNNMQYPHDPAAPAEQVINCFVPDTRIQGRIHSGFRMRYQGPVLELCTRGGFVLTVTPNHPVMGLNGWIAARFLQQGQYLLCYRPRVEKTAFGAAAVEINKHRTDARIEDVFGALAITGALRAVRRVEDFHGDAVFGQEQIDVVGAASHLLCHKQAKMAQFNGELTLAQPDMRNSITPRSGALPPPSHGLDLPAPCALGGANLGRDGFRAALSQRLPYDATLIGDAADIDASLYQTSAHDVAADAQLATEFLDRHASVVFADQVISVRRLEFSGHVYDVQTYGGWIVADGIIASNCGCTCLPWMEGWDVRDPGAKPYSETELARNPAKGALDRGAKKSGYRPEPLANADKAFMAKGKVEGYALNTSHHVGGHKAKVMESALGYNVSNADEFRQALRQALPNAAAKLKARNSHGYVLYTVDVLIENGVGREFVRTGWRVGHNDTSRTPELTTAYVRDRKPKSKGQKK